MQVPTGTYVMTARATSANGTVTVSAPVTLVVNGDAALHTSFFDFNTLWDTTGFFKDGSNAYYAQPSGNVTQVAAPASGGKADTCKSVSFAGGVIDLDDFPVTADAGGKTAIAFWVYLNGADAAMPFSLATHGILLLSSHFG